MNYQHLKQLIEEHKVIHLCGIGGVSMRALARLLQQMGATVQGSLETVKAQLLAAIQAEAKDA